ncbi:nitrogen fixation protein NifZ [Acuticoccus sediminis]|uniref:Nitrogen fixation protein NifZ n=1 Tax=Acuticoccus sediminis TaxID=2184697 RepID=A0A8B2NWJ1_9HYPH|nr:nitrogen fixation protein NifZ [Acuticoccus sediminis]RAI00721.1 nitrogen fixation protein NifZ [Acuticoccus sediminis]
MTDASPSRPPLPLEPRTPKYDWGQRIACLADLYNDGSYPELAADALLVRAGEKGEIVRVGMHTDTNTPIYLVEFDSTRVVGCTEDEIAPVH